MERSHAQAVMDDLHDALGRRLAVSSLAPCPVEFTAALVNLCSTQSCGKCTPCRVGLSALSDLLADVLEGRADESTLNLIERTARTIYLSSDCAIGYEAGAMALTAIRGFRDDFEHHIREHSCGFDREARVPCVSGCPAHVDIPGYISLVEAGRYADAVKVIRKNNPLPLVCGLVCEHPCEMHCRRGMVDDPMNILALKRFAVEHSDLNDHKPHVVDNTGKCVAVIGGGPAGLSCAYYLAVMGHKVTIFEQRHHLGGMLRYGIPSYRLPRERLQAEIDWILSAGIDVELDHSVNGEELARLRDEFDAVYLAIGAHSDKKLGLPGEEAPGVESAVKMLRAIGDDELPDLSGQRVCVIGGGNVAMDVARELMRNADDLKERTDIPDNVYEGIKANKAKTLHLFIRRGVAQAKFSVQELREMEKLPGVQLIINEDDFDLDDDTIEEAGKDKLTRQMVEELFTIREMAEDMEDDGDTDFEGNPADRKYYIHFNSAPVEVLGEDGKVKAIRVEKTTTSADGKMTRTGEFEEYPVQAVYHAIGYKPATAPGIAYDERRAHLANANGDGRITTEASGEGAQVRERLYATGWAKRGPVGLIGSTKSDALAIVTNMLEDLAKAAEGGRVAEDRDPKSIDRLLAERGVKPIDFAGWKKVDAYERAEGAKEGREHKKVIDPEQMRALAHA